MARFFAWFFAASLLLKSEGYTYIRRDKRSFVCDATVVRRQLTLGVFHREGGRSVGSGLKLFYARGDGSSIGAEGTIVAVHYGVYVPRLPARPQDCIIDIRPTPVPLSTEYTTCVQVRKVSEACVLERDYSWIFHPLEYL